MTGAWWISRADQTLALYDDPWSMALDNAWSDLLPAVDAIGFGRAPTLVRVRAASWLDADASVADSLDEEELSELRDEGMLLVEGADSLRALSTVEGMRLLGHHWDALHEGGMVEPDLSGFPETEVHIAILDIVLQDRFSRGDVAGDLSLYRVDLSLTIYTRDGAEAHLGSTGFARDANDRRVLETGWFLLCALVGGLLVWVRSRGRGLTSPIPATQLAAMGAVAFVAGAVLSGVASDFTDAYLPDWGTPMWSEQGTPDLSGLLWPLVHGAVVMGGPIALLTWAAVRLPSRLSPALADRLRPADMVGVVGPTAQAGATAQVFATMVLAEPESWWRTALPIAAVSVVAAVVASGAGAALLAGTADASRALVRGGVATGILLIVFPLGLFSSWAWPVSALALLSLAVVSWQGRERGGARQAPSSAVVEASLEAAAAAADGLRRPQWLEVLAVDELAGRVLREGELTIVGMSRAGATRTAVELRQTLRDGDVNTLWVDAGADPGLQLPFGVATRLMQLLGHQMDLHERHQRVASADGLFGELEGLAEDLPGVGFLLKLAGDPPESMERSRVVEDAARLIVRSLRVTGRAVVFVDGIEGIDPASAEVLVRVKDLVDTDTVAWVWGGLLGAAEPDAASPWADAAVVTVPELSPEEVAALCRCCGVPDPSDELVDVLHGTARGLAGAVHDLLISLHGQGLLVPGTAGLGLLEGCSRDDLLDALVRLRVQHEQRRIAALPAPLPDVLRSAALCGRDATAVELSGGTGLDLVEVAGALQVLSGTPGTAELIELDGSDGRYRFLSEVTRRALVAEIDGPRESGEPGLVARALHARMACAVPRPTPLRRLRHAQLAGTLAGDEGEKALVEACSELSRRRGWSELLALLDASVGLRGGLGPGPGLTIDLVEARACRSVGGQANRDRALARLWARLSGGIASGIEPDRLAEVALEWGDLAYEEKSGVELSELRRRAVALSREVASPLVRAVLDLYALLAELYPSRGAAPARIQVLREAVETMPPGRGQRQLLSRLLLNEANHHWFAAWDAPLEERARVLRTRAEPLFARALTLKETLGDHSGMAMVLGSRAGALQAVGDLEGAEASLLADLEICEKAGLDSDLSLVQNKLSVVYRDRFKGQEDPDPALLEEAMRLAIGAAEAADRLDREQDLAFAVGQVLSVWILGRTCGIHALRPDEAWLERAGERLREPALWDHVTFRYARLAVSEPLSKLEDAVPWAGAVLSLCPVPPEPPRSA